LAKDSGVKLHACSPTMRFMDVKEENLIPEVDDIVGASAFLS
jgi:peroxiredoxin family protein